MEAQKCFEDHVSSFWGIYTCNALKWKENNIPFIKTTCYLTCGNYSSTCNFNASCRTSSVSVHVWFCVFSPGISMTFLFLFSCRYTWWALSVPSPSTPTLHCDLVSQWEQSFPSVLCMQVPAAMATCNILLLISPGLASLEEIANSTL